MENSILGLQMEVLLTFYSIFGQPWVLGTIVATFQKRMDEFYLKSTTDEGLW